MQEFKQHRGIAMPFIVNYVDTDQIIPSREIKKVSRVGLADGLFSGQRFHYDGDIKIGPNPDFIFNQTPYEKSTIILTGKNFGCGSSREHAVWALVEYGFKVLIAESFGGIFRNNCIRNGLLPITLSAEQINNLVKQTAENPQDSQLVIDLETCQIHSPDNSIFTFELEDYCQKMLLNGWDFIDLTLQHETDIDGFTEIDRKLRNWAYL